MDREAGDVGRESAATTAQQEAEKPVATGAQDQDEKSNAGAWSDDFWLRKTRPCKYAIMEIACMSGDKCTYAHGPEELRPLPEGYYDNVASHWQGAAVCIGVVEHAMFWDLPPVGTTDVICNRASCLGNPFANVLYEKAPPLDREGWCPQEHEDLCAAFEEYLCSLLSAPAKETLDAIVGRIVAARHVTLAETWLMQKLDRAYVLGALEACKRRVQAGERIRLLCHCRPHVRCHTEYIKAYLERFAPPEKVRAVDVHAVKRGHLGCVWPGVPRDGMPPQPRCPSFSSPSAPCGRAGRALDPGKDQLHCAQCWLRRGSGLKAAVGVERVDVTAKLEKSVGGGGGGSGKRQFCFFHSGGICKFGDACYFRHTSDSDEEAEDPQKSTEHDPIVACPYYTKEKCLFGAACVYGHDPAGADGQWTKTAMCRYFQSGRCAYGSECTFAHSADELTRRPVCSFFLQGGCHFGASCVWAHPSAAQGSTRAPEAEAQQREPVAEASAAPAPAPGPTGATPEPVEGSAAAEAPPASNT